MLRIIILLLSFTLLQGCNVGIGAAIVVGAAAGYYYGKDHRNLDQVSTDQNISAEINTALYRQAGVKPSHVEVYCYEQRVILQGTVETEDAAQRVIDIARNTRGVTEVQSELRVVSPYN